MSGHHENDALVPWEDCVKLRSTRRALGWTQLELSLRLGVSERTVQAIERGELRQRRAYVHEILTEFSADILPWGSPPMADPVQHPPHYGGDVPHETYKCLAAWGLESDALLWNAAKYISRAGKNGSGPGAKAEDIRKAIWYLNLAVERTEQQ